LGGTVAALTKSNVVGSQHATASSQPTTSPSSSSHIQAYLGHRSIMSTVRYTALTPNRFKDFWKD
jgi:hypothetical protein